MKLDELKRCLANRATTPGEWLHKRVDQSPRLADHGVASSEPAGGWAIPPGFVSKEDAALIAAMRNALPDLIAAVEALRSAVANDGFITDSDHHKAYAILKRLGVE